MEISPRLAIHVYITRGIEVPVACIAPVVRIVRIDPRSRDGEGSKREDAGQQNPINVITNSRFVFDRGFSFPLMDCDTPV